ncbi:MAG: AI-2E family transporter [Actinobacteria bacterium]|nr:AI-2E family transporter [Actinomycetota bacterium]MSW35886.1 AI-2E family transporter [Actinomycetota bacterium]
MVSDQEPDVIALAGTSEGKAVPVRFESRALRRSAVTLLAIFVTFQVAEWAFASLGRFLFMLLLAWLLSIAMEPGVTWLANHGIRRGAATGIVLVSIMIASIAFLAVFGSLFFSQLSELIGQLPSTITQLTTWANDTFHLTLDAGKILEQLQVSPSQIAGLASNLAGGVFGALGLIFGALFDALTVVVFAFYFSADGPRLRRAIGSWLPLKSQQVFVTVWDIAVTKTGGFVVSKVVLATMSAFFHAAFFAIIGVPYWLPMGIFAGVVSQFIPTIGTYIGVAIPALFAAFTDPIDVVWIIVFATIYQNIESYVFTPRVSRATMDIHPAIALGSVFVGIALFGPIGALIGIPLAAAVLAVIETYGQRHALTDELRARTKGEKPARLGDALAGDPARIAVTGNPVGGGASPDTGDAS